jgi:hypothetical protein
MPTNKLGDRTEWDSHDGVLTIEVALKDIESCKQAVEMLHTGILLYHGMDTANKTLAKAQNSKRQIKDNMNIYLLCEVEDRLRGGASIEQVAADLAKRNETLPQKERLGPTGTTTPSTMATQIRRLKKRYAGSTKVAAKAKVLRDIEKRFFERLTFGHFENEMSGHYENDLYVELFV